MFDVLYEKTIELNDRRGNLVHLRVMSIMRGEEEPALRLEPIDRPDEGEEFPLTQVEAVLDSAGELLAMVVGACVVARSTWERVQRLAGEDK